MPYDSKSELYEQIRRYSLQSVCLGTASMKSIWPSKGRSLEDFKHLMTLVGGDDDGGKRVYGHSVNVHSWAQDGFSFRDPGECNTWSAEYDKVA